jgi:hypothetical protein
MTDWVVGLEQREPYEFVQIEVFTEQLDALDYATRYARGRGYIRISKRRWRFGEDDHQSLLIVWRRT